MKAGVIHRFGGPEVLRIEEIGQPQAKPGEVLIRLRAAGLNRADVLVREGRFAELDKQQPLPIILGVEGAGDIAGLGEGVSSLRVGQRVAVLPMLTCGTCPECDAGRVSECAALTIVGEHVDGTYAQYIALPARNAIPVPEQADLTYEQLSVSIVAYMTAWHMLRTRGGLTKGETVLVVGAGSGMGSAAVRLASALGARVIATSGTDGKGARLREIGADEVINYRTTPDFPGAVLEITGGRGVDLVHDTAGGATFQKSIDSLRHGGRLIGMGSHTGRVAEVNLVSIHRKEIDIRGAHTAHIGEIEEFLPLLADGSLVPVIDSVYPLDRAADAQRRLTSEDRFGKVVLSID
ncbi:zinc-binding dehydrogenase [Actinomadura madurae]|uniref:zinc-binding dehydrogenase n=1 Tax=Actinomadura madurae TaxID=1993 RepID=UPI0020265588|nr:zinc-binding dehydrogenase [Actinomadura madurae]URN01160.1 zinc-binding dehydrogenase [Actinomadura madurae]